MSRHRRRTTAPTAKPQSRPAAKYRPARSLLRRVILDAMAPLSAAIAANATSSEMTSGTNDST